MSEAIFKIIGLGFLFFVYLTVVFLKFAGKNSRGLKWASLLVLLFSVICGFSVFTATSHAWLFSSDAVSVQLIYDDLISGGGHLKDWYFPTSPSLFPDLILFSLVQVLQTKFMLNILWYALLQMVIISFLGMYIFEKTMPVGYKNYSWLVPCLFSIIFMEAYYFSKDIFMNQLLTSCYYHAGPFVSCLFSYALYLSPWRNPLKYISFFLLALIATFSDMLYLVMFVFPFGLSLLINLQKANVKQVLGLIFCVATGAFTGLKIYYYVMEAGLTYFYNPHKMYEYSNILPSLKIFLAQMWDYITTPGFRSFHILFTVLSLPAMALIYLFKRKSLSPEIRVFFVFAVVFSTAVIAAPILNGNYTAYDTLRYNVACFYLSIITLAFFVAYLLENKVSKPVSKVYLSYSILLVFFVLIAARFSFSGLKYYSDYYPEPARGLDSLSEKYQLKNGIANIRYSKMATVFSRKNIKVLTVHPINGFIYEMTSNIQWYYNTEFDFIITHGLNVNFREKFTVLDSFKLNDITVLKVKKFHYPTGTYEPVTK